MRGVPVENIDPFCLVPYPDLHGIRSVIGSLMMLPTVSGAEGRVRSRHSDPFLPMVCDVCGSRSTHHTQRARGRAEVAVRSTSHAAAEEASSCLPSSASASPVQSVESQLLCAVLMGHHVAGVVIGRPLFTLCTRPGERVMDLATLAIASSALFLWRIKRLYLVFRRDECGSGRVARVVLSIERAEMQGARQPRQSTSLPDATAERIFPACARSTEKP